MTNLWAVGSSLIFVGGVLDAAISDLNSFRIPNRSPAILLAGFPLFAWATHLGMAGWLDHLGVGLALFALGALLFGLRIWGGGDAKLVAATGLWVGLAGLSGFLTIMTTTGGVLALVGLAARAIPALPFKAWGQRQAVPYGIAIAAAGLTWWYGLPAFPAF